MATGADGKQGAKPDINVTPLVDVVLVLLIIFMVVTPQLEAGENVELPSIDNPDPKAKSKLDPVTVTATLSGRLFIDKTQVSDEELALKLKAIHAQSPDRRLLLKGDRAIGFGRMRALFATAKDVGFGGVSLVVGERQKPGQTGRGD